MDSRKSSFSMPQEEATTHYLDDNTLQTNISLL